MYDVLGLRGKGRLDDGRCKMAEGRCGFRVTNQINFLNKGQVGRWKMEDVRRKMEENDG